MNIYIVSVDDYDWDEWISFVVIADDPTEAREICAIKTTSRYSDNQAESFRNRSECELISSYHGKYKRPQIIHGSFNAG